MGQRSITNANDAGQVIGARHGRANDIPGKIAQLFSYSYQIIGWADTDRDHFGGELKAAYAAQYAGMLCSICRYSQWEAC